MFSGIIRFFGIVEAIEEKNSLINLTITTNLKNVIQGDSISINGTCLTVTMVESLESKSRISFQVTEETLLKTNFSKLKIKDIVNIEPSIKMGDKLDGHLVSGHIDAIGQVLEIEAKEENRIIKILFPKELKKFIAPKGSITVNGVSLTVIDTLENFFTFTLIPFTRDNTNLGILKINDLVNLEIDLVSRYLINYVESTSHAVNLSS